MISNQAPGKSPASNKKAKASAPASGAMAKSDPSTQTAPAHEMIAQKAYELWLASGQQPGCEEQNWFEAERQLRQSPRRDQRA
jgi:hypothetical protein